MIVRNTCAWHRAGSFKKTTLVFIMTVGFAAKSGSEYSFLNCLKDVGSSSTKPKVVVQVAKVKSCCELATVYY